MATPGRLHIARVDRLVQGHVVLMQPLLKERALALGIRLVNPGLPRSLAGVQFH